MLSKTLLKCLSRRSS